MCRIYVIKEKEGQRNQAYIPVCNMSCGRLDFSSPRGMHKAKLHATNTSLEI